MKNYHKIPLFMLFWLAAMIFPRCMYATPVITKTASKTSVRVGERFTYQISISNLTNLSDLGSIRDVLPNSLQFISSDFNTTSVVNGFYNVWCGGTLSYSSTGGTLLFQFPTGSGCGGSSSGVGTLTFSYDVFVTNDASACNGNQIQNTAELFSAGSPPPAAPIATGNCNISIDHSNPWTLNKTFRAMTGGYLVYDVRLNSAVAAYYSNIWSTSPTLPQFTDVFTIPGCITVDYSTSEVVFIPDENNLNSYISLGTPANPGSGNQLIFNWGFLNPNVNPTPSSYLFQVRIKVTGCNCTAGNTFSMNNQVDFAAKDICNADVTCSNAYLMNTVSCVNNTPNCPEKPTVKIWKEVHLIGNTLKLTQNGCQGYYEIHLQNITSTYNYTQINISDVIPPELIWDQANTAIILAPAGYTANLSFTSTTLTIVNTSNQSLQPTEEIVIKIPFTVNTILPNYLIQNCANASVTLTDINNSANQTTVNQQFCDPGIRTVPNYTAISMAKSICSSTDHYCATMNSHNYNNLPGDEVEYGLHFYNYGTARGTHLTLKDQLPNYFSIQNLTTDVKVYKVSSGSNIGNFCDPASIANITDITGNVALTLSSSQKLSIDFLSNELDEFTCSGVLHYIVKIKTKISLAATQGVYNNAFSVSYTDPQNNAHTDFSNVVTSYIQPHGLLFSKKTSTEHHNCFKKTDTIDYEIVLLNYSNVTVYANMHDVITVPSPLSLVNGISNLKYCHTITTPVCANVSDYYPLVSGSGMVVYVSGLTMNITNMPIQPCEYISIKYRIVVNTNYLNAGSKVNLCNNLDIKHSFSQQNTGGGGRYRVISIQNPQLIQTYLNSTDQSEKLQAYNDMQDEVMKRNPAYFHPQRSTIISDSVHITRCDSITDCLNGHAVDCGSNYLQQFKINSVIKSNNILVANTSLTLNGGAPAVKKIEYILSDIRMIAPSGHSNYPCFKCNKNVTGTFWSPSAFPGYSVYATYPGPGIFRESNLITVTPNVPSVISSQNMDFNLPTGNPNCNGNLEFVITAVIYLEDCSVCFISDSKDYRCNCKDWSLPSKPSKPWPGNGSVFDKK